MYDFSFLLFQRSRQLFPEDCIPDYCDDGRIRYEKAHRPFRLAAASYPRGLEIRHLFVRHDLRGQGIGSDVVSALQMFCHSHSIDTITIQNILEPAEAFWAQHGFAQDEWGTGRWDLQ